MNGRTPCSTCSKPFSQTDCPHCKDVDTWYDQLLRQVVFKELDAHRNRIEVRHSVDDEGRLSKDLMSAAKMALARKKIRANLMAAAEATRQASDRWDAQRKMLLITYARPAVKEAIAAHFARSAAAGVINNNRPPPCTNCNHSEWWPDNQFAPKSIEEFIVSSLDQEKPVNIAPSAKRIMARQMAEHKIAELLGDKYPVQPMEELSE